MNLPLPVVLTAATILPVVSVSTHAQGYVSPPHFRACEAPSSETRPFSTGSPTFVYQQIHDDVPAGTYRGLAFRRDGQRRAMPARSMNVEVWVSSSSVRSTNPGRTVAANHGSNKVRVRASNALLNLPATSARPRQTLPDPFEYPVAFSVPFLHRGGALAWEIRVVARTSGGSIYLDAVRGPKSSPANPRIVLGSGCRSSYRNRRVGLSFAMSHNWSRFTGTWTISGSNYLPSKPVVLGVSAAPLPVPFRLPGSGTAASGACDVQIQPVLALPQMAKPNGTLDFRASVTLFPALHGQHFAAQSFVPDAAANPAGWVTSDAIMRQVRAPWPTPPVATLYYRASAGSATPAKGVGLITEFRR